MAEMITYDFIYELMRAYKGSNLLVNKRLVGGKVESFLDIPNSIMQYVRLNGIENRYQAIEFHIPFHIKREKAIEEYFKKIEKEVFKDKLLPITDEEIEHFNQYWKLEHIGYVFSVSDEEDDIAIWKSDKELHMFSLHRGKTLHDGFQIFFKPLAYKGG